MKYGVEQFDGSNFNLWIRRIESVFAAKNLDIYLTREADVEKPEEVTASKKAYALMLSFLSDKILVSLSEEHTCAAILAKLSHLCSRRSRQSNSCSKETCYVEKEKGNIYARTHR